MNGHVNRHNSFGSALSVVRLNSTLPQMLERSFEIYDQFKLCPQVRGHLQNAVTETVSYLTVSPNCSIVFVSLEGTIIPEPSRFSIDLSKRGQHFFYRPDPFTLSDCDLSVEMLLYAAEVLLRHLGYDFATQAARWNPVLVPQLIAFLVVENGKRIRERRDKHHGWGFLNANFNYVLDNRKIRLALRDLAHFCGYGTRPGDILHAFDIVIRRSHQVFNAKNDNHARFVGYGLFEDFHVDRAERPTRLFAEIERILKEVFVSNLGDCATLVGALRPIVQSISEKGELDVNKATSVLEQHDGFRRTKAGFLRAVKAGTRIGLPFVVKRLVDDWRISEYEAAWRDVLFAIAGCILHVVNPEHFKTLCRSPVFISISEPSVRRKGCPT